MEAFEVKERAPAREGPRAQPSGGHAVALERLYRSNGNRYRALAKLETTDGDAVLVDPDTGVAIAWIPSPKAFGKETIVWRTSETVSDTPEARVSLSLAALHPGAAVRKVSRAELERALAAQYPKG